MPLVRLHWKIHSLVENRPGPTCYWNLYSSEINTPWKVSTYNNTCSDIMHTIWLPFSWQYSTLLGSETAFDWSGSGMLSRSGFKFSNAQFGWCRSQLVSKFKGWRRFPMLILVELPVKGREFSFRSCCWRRSSFFLRLNLDCAPFFLRLWWPLPLGVCYPSTNVT